MERYLAGRSIILTHEFEADQDEDSLTPVTVAVTVTAAGASTPTVSGNATVAGSVYTFVAGALVAGTYSVTWNGGATVTDTVWIEVVSARLFSIKRARSLDEELTAQRYPTDRMLYYRTAVEDDFERITGRSFIPVTRRVRFEADGRDVAWLGMLDVQQLVSIHDADGVAVALADYDIELDSHGIISGISSLSCGSYVATVRYGFLAVPRDIERVAVLRLRYYLAAEKSGIPDRATTYQPDNGGTYILSTPGMRGARTGIPDVDSVLADYTPDMAYSFLVTV